jgi:RNA polymerase sigma-70 factor (ECF subfamily)
MGMVHKRAVDAVRREEAQRRRADEASVHERTGSADGVARCRSPQERRGGRLDALPPDQRQDELMYFECLAVAAAWLSVPLGTVKSCARSRCAAGTRCRDDR